MAGDASKGSAASSRDPAASMSLIGRITSSSLDPGYRKYAEANNGRNQSWWGTIVVLVVCIALGAGATWAAKNLRVVERSLPQALAGLAEQVEQTQDAVAGLEDEVTTLSEQIQANEGESGPATKSSEALAVAAATTRVVGDGLVVTITDNFGTPIAPLVEDTDIRALVNALWAGGAEAIAIDGTRVGPQTTIRTAGSAILVNLTAIDTPYVIEAIGDQDLLIDSLYSGVAATAIRKMEDRLGMSITTTRSSALILGPLMPTQMWHVSTLGSEN